MNYRLSQRSLNRLEGVNPILIDILKIAIINSPYDFGIPMWGGLRTAEDQHQLFLRGVSQLDGYNKKSNHQSGNAFDIYLYINGKASWDRNKLEEVARHIQKVAKKEFNTTLRWGGDWDMDGIRVDKDSDENFFDGAHLELA